MNSVIYVCFSKYFNHISFTLTLFLKIILRFPALDNHLINYSLHSKIFAPFDFSTSRLIIRLIQKNYENVIYFTVACFIIIYILNMS
jgi:hypothetical protein